MNILVFNYNGILTEVSKKLEEQGHRVISHLNNISKKELDKFDIWVTWQETEASNLRPLIQNFQSKGKKVILVQHGRRGTSRIFPPFNEGVVSDKVCLWGQGDYERHIEAGTPKEKLVITGSPVVKWVRDNVIKKKHEGKNVLFIPEHWGVEVTENFIVAGQLRKLKHKVITKLLYGEHSDLYTNPVYSDRNKGDHLQVLAQCLEVADVVVGISESTAEIMAQVLDIPVVIADIWQPKVGANGDERYLTYRREYSNACDRVKKIFDLNNRIEYALKHPEYLRNERFIVSKVDGGVEMKNPVENIIKVILNESN